MSSHYNHKCGHEENRRKVCTPCGNKIKIKIKIDNNNGLGLGRVSVLHEK